MNVASVNTLANRGIGGRGNSRNAPAWQRGQILEGLITKVSSQISINFNDREVKVSPSAVRNAKEGEIRKFEIMDVSKKSIVLKEVGSDTLGSGSIQVAITGVDTGQAVFSDQMDQAAREKKKDAQTKEGQRYLEHLVGQMTEQDYKDVTDADISTEEYTAAQLDMALERVKEQRAFDRSMMENQVERQVEEKEQVEQIGESKPSPSQLSSQMAERLKKADVPVTEENITKLMEALNLSQSANDMKPDSYRYLIENQLPASAENIYKATFIGGTSKKTPVGNEVWKELQKQAETVITQSGMEVTEESLKDARWILENQMPLTSESLKRLDALKEMTDTLTVEQAVDRMVLGMRSGQSPEKVNLEPGAEEFAKKFVEKLKTISDKAVIAAVKTANITGSEVTPAGLMTEQNAITAGSSGTRETEFVGKVLKTADIETVIVRRQLEEIRLKMTADTALRMIGKGIDLDVTGLNKIVEELRETENSYYRSLLQSTATQETEEQISLLRETKDILQDLKTLPSYVLGSTLLRSKTETIRELHTAGTELKAKFERANAAYDTLKTEPRKDLGDSIQNAFQSVDHILQDMNVELTESNRRAVRILGYNSMEITEKSISQVKAYDAQVNDLIKNLHPAAALQLIKNGTNPLNTPISALNEQVSGIKKELGLSDDEKYSKYLWKMEKESGITSEERKAYIGFYRLLNNVEKTDGAAIGSLLQTQQDVTLNNLLRAVKTIKSGGIDRTIDDSFGALESITFETETISEQLSNAFNGSEGGQKKDEAAYQESLLKNVLDEISPAKLRRLGTSDKIMDHSLEWLKEELDIAEEDPAEEAFAKEQINVLKDLAKSSESALRFLNDFEMPDTLGNIVRANQFMSSSENPMKALGLKLKKITGKDEKEEEKEEVKEAIEGFSEALKDKESMLEQYDKLDQTVKHILKSEYGDNRLTAKDLADLKSLTSGITFARDMAKKECYQIPLAVGDRITNINLTIIHSGESKGKINVAVDSDQLGHMTGDFNVINGNLKGVILADNQKGMDQMKAHVDVLRQKCEEAGLSLQQINFGTIRGTQTSYISQKGNQGSSHDQANTKQLYRVAKAFVLLVKQAEG